MRDLSGPVKTPPGDDLFYAADPPAQVIGVEIEEGSGVLVRGSVLVRQGGGDYALLGGDPKGAAVAVLCDDADTTGAPETVYAAYAAGNFKTGKLTAAAGKNLRDYAVNGQLYPGLFINDAADGAA